MAKLRKDSIQVREMGLDQRGPGQKMQKLPSLHREPMVSKFRDQLSIISEADRPAGTVKLPARTGADQSVSTVNQRSTSQA